MKRSDVSLTPQDFLMNTASTENLQEQWLGSPVQTAFSIKNVQTLTSLNILQMRVTWWSKKIQKNGDLSLLRLLKKEELCSNVLATTLTKRKTISGGSLLFWENFG